MRIFIWCMSAVLFASLCASLFAMVNASFDPMKHPIRSVSFWKDFRAKSWSEKIGVTPPAELIDYLRKDNQANGWPNIPKIVNVPSDFLKDLHAAMEELPPVVSQKINAMLIGVFLVSDLGGTGYTEYVVDENGKPTAALVVLDVSALNRTANQWATWKESSPFQWMNGCHLEAIIENPQDDNRKNAIQYILLHEFGHVVATGSPLLPPGGVYPKNVILNGDIRFFNLTWSIKENEFVSRFDSEWKNRPRVHYYVGPDRQMDGCLAVEEYRSLLGTNFPTLYAATHPADDFAESFVSYVHVILLRKPWKVRVTGGATSIDIGPCWNEPRCAEKKNIITEMIGP